MEPCLHSQICPHGVVRDTLPFFGTRYDFAFCVFYKSSNSFLENKCCVSVFSNSVKEQQEGRFEVGYLRTHMMSIQLSAIFSNAGQTVTERQNLVSREMTEIPHLLSQKTWHFVSAVPHSFPLILIQLCCSRITLISCFFFAIA